MCPDYAAILSQGDYYPHCSTTLLQPVSKLKPEMLHDTSHCSVLMLSPGLAHVSIIPVDCTAKFWNIVLCGGKSNDTRHREPDNAGRGEYRIFSNSLVQSNYMCPNGCNIVIDGLCLKLTLIQAENLQFNGTYNLLNVYRHDLCRNSTSYAAVFCSKA